MATVTRSNVIPVRLPVMREKSLSSRSDPSLIVKAISWRLTRRNIQNAHWFTPWTERQDCLPLPHRVYCGLRDRVVVVL